MLESGTHLQLRYALSQDGGVRAPLRLGSGDGKVPGTAWTPLWTLSFN